MVRAQKTVISPDIIRSDTPLAVESGRTSPIILMPMAEWKQALVRGIRSAVQFMIVLAGGGSIASASAGVGLPPGILPVLSTGNAYWDMVIVSLVAGLFVFLWNAAEFWFALDRKAPEYRA